MAEALRRTDPKQALVSSDGEGRASAPLKMKDTSVGLCAPIWRSRKVVPDFRSNYHIGHRGTQRPRA